MSTASLRNRAALVTGSSRGIGAEIARALADAGARVMVHYNQRVEAAQALVAEIRRKGGQASAAQADLSDPRAAANLVRQAAESLGGLDILVNNAATWAGGALPDIHDEQIDQLLAVNVRSLIITTREFARLERSKERGGRVINISSIGGSVPSGGASLYACSKAAVNSLTRSHAMELGARGITVNAVAPGTTETDMSSNFSPAMREAIVRGTPLGRLGGPEDIAPVVVFLCSDAARWVTGQILGVDGGMLTGAFALAKVRGAGREV